jgi:hypothetical protein
LLKKLKMPLYGIINNWGYIRFRSLTTKDQHILIAVLNSYFMKLTVVLFYTIIMAARMRLKGV